MRHLLLPLLIVLTVGACTPYQYLTLDSSQLHKNDQKQFVWENDTLRLSYDFSGPYGPMNVSIYNKTPQPLYVNWKKSALIRDERSFSLYDNNVIVNTQTNYYATRVGRLSVGSSTGTSAFSMPEGMDFIAPGSGISKNLLRIGQSGGLRSYVSDSLPTERVTGADGVYVARYKRLTFNEDQSPVRFKSYITFTLGAENSPEFSETHSFYVGEVLQTTSTPDLFALYQPEGDKIYVKAPAQ
jgi:hypothetical protein